jgi:hypothetical protein
LKKIVTSKWGTRKVKGKQLQGPQQAWSKSFGLGLSLGKAPEVLQAFEIIIHVRPGA